ncbi:MAG: methionyl-tRNA formyltransferase [Gemmatimonadetes bacterium]|nr:methionyl-tRNA formyltransferase [Gemmatimonadota bacterium]
MRIVFWGTPEFGIPSLDAMVDAGHEIVAVVTNPDRPAGRGRSLRASPVKTWAAATGALILQPERPRGDAFLARLGELEPDISVVAAYGQILVDEVLALPRLGSINVHASLLPELRGAAPINWAIIRGHERGGVTIMRMVRALDAGAIIAQRSIPIGESTTAGALYAETATQGARLLVSALADLEAGRAREVEQDEERATYAPKLDRARARIDWSRSATEVHRWIRGCDPWPAAWTTHAGVPLQCFTPTIPVGDDAITDDAEPGVVLEAGDRTGLLVQTGSGALRVDEVKPAGRKRMSAAAWARGTEVVEGVRLD